MEEFYREGIVEMINKDEKEQRFAKRQRIESGFI